MTDLSKTLHTLIILYYTDGIPLLITQIYHSGELLLADLVNAGIFIPRPIG